MKVIIHPHAARRDLKWLFKIHHMCTLCLYIIFLLCIFLNLYVLLSRENTIFYLRIYHSVTGILMVACGVVMIEFLLRTRKLPKLDEPHEIPEPALIGAVALTIGIVVGYLYFIIFNYAFQSCDKLVDAIYGSELWLDAMYSVLMAAFSALSLFYIIQRCYYGAINSNLDKVGRLFINITFSVVWIKIVVYKGYLSHQELCQRKELEGYWCPVVKRHYDCDPAYDLHGTQKIWYYLNKGLLNSSIIACASEYFPVLLVSHWLSCGGGEEKAEEVLRRRQQKQGLRSLMRDFMKDISRVYATQSQFDAPPLQVCLRTKILFWILVPLATIAATIHWLVYFYFAIDFDHLLERHWLTADIVALIFNVLAVSLFAAIYAWTWKLSDDRLDAHHKAHARGDIIILFGCCLVLFLKLILQSIEIVYQHKDGFITTTDVWLQTLSLVIVQGGEWLQYFAVRRLLSLSDADIRATRHFLPFVAIGGVIIAWIRFGSTFFETSLIKYQLTDEGFKFSETTLICMIFTQTIFPADYLFSFTVSGCYLELLIRFHEIGFFQLGVPRLEEHPHAHGGHVANGHAVHANGHNGHPPHAIEGPRRRTIDNVKKMPPETETETTRSDESLTPSDKRRTFGEYKVNSRDLHEE